jgi:hypothetical protein
MPKKFFFTLSNEQQSKYIRQGRAMHIMAALLLFCYVLSYAGQFQENWMIVLGVILPALTIFFVALFKADLLMDANNNRIFRILESGFLMMGCMHFLQLDQLLPALLFGLVSAIMLFLLWMESRILQTQHILFNESVIELELPLATKKYTWNELQAVMIKNDYLTLSFKDSTIRQLRIKDDYPPQVEGDFLFFCKDCIAR